jgi:hypothetical protein
MYHLNLYGDRNGDGTISMITQADILK